MSKLEKKICCPVRGLPCKDLGIIDRIKLRLNKLKFEIILTNEKIIIKSKKSQIEILFKDILKIKFKKYFIKKTILFFITYSYFPTYILYVLYFNFFG